MRVIAKSAVIGAMLTHSQWQPALSLWLVTFDRPALRFKSFGQLRQVWLATTGWNVDRVPCSRLRPTSQKGPLDIYVFDIKKNECRIVTWINVNNGTIFIKAILSHAAYDKWCKADVK